MSKQPDDLNIYLRSCFRADGKPKQKFIVKNEAIEYFDSIKKKVRIYWCGTHSCWHAAKER